MGFELLTYAVLALALSSDCAIRVFGDNKGVVEGWWNGRSRNSAVNGIFRRVHAHLEATDRIDSICATYVQSADNPADEPSHGIYASRSLLLPPINLPADIGHFLIDATAPLSPIELHLMHEGAYPTAASKAICSAVDTLERDKFNCARFLEHCINAHPEHRYNAQDNFR